VLNIELPKLIQTNIKDMTFIKDEVGCSEASVYCFKNDERTLYLKIEKINQEFEHEQKVMHWLQEKLPVPKIIAQLRECNYDYLIMTEVPGEMACSEIYLNNPEELVRLLAEGIKMLQAVDILSCPFDLSLRNKLNTARERIEQNKIDTSDWEDNTLFKSPKELYDYLLTNQPDEELVFSHGDYCLPNVIFQDRKISGFIDLGRAGVADKWQDIALCVRSLEHNLGNNGYIDLFFEYLGIKPDYEKIRYYILLDELF
jgi:kanamycin kinase/aminoglycoside 3'-phosphotransferase-3